MSRKNVNKKDRNERFAFGMIVAVVVGLALGCVLAFVMRVSAAGRFTDVPSGAWYSEAVDWAVENGITNGVTAEEFRPNDPCTRAEVVTFLYRYDKLRFGGGVDDPTPTETTPTEPPETEPVVTEPAETEAPSEPEPYNPVVFEYSYSNSYWSGDEIEIEPLGGNLIRVEFPGIGAQFCGGDTVRISFDGSASAYMKGLYSWKLDMSLEQPVTALLNRECEISEATRDAIVIAGDLDVDMAFVCMLGSRNKPAWIRVEK